MKVINRFLVCAVSAASLITSIPQAQAQTANLCAINSHNYTRFTSTYNLFGDTANTPLRPFVSNIYTYKIASQTTATPIYYTSVDNGNGVVVAFNIKGRWGKSIIKNNDSFVQYIGIPQGSAYARILGSCVNGTYIKDGSTFPVYKLPQNTQAALQEAQYGVTQETVGNMFR